MLLDVRSTSINIAVLFFFILGGVGWASGLSCFVCCKRALTGAVALYILSCLVIKALNAIVLNAAVNAKTDMKKEPKTPQ
jgi:hypothetical protein